MLTEDERQQERHDATRRRFDPSAAPPPAGERLAVAIGRTPDGWPRFVFVTPPLRPSTLLADERRAHVQWEQERRERIRRGACPACGERFCPRVGGSDLACVPV